MTAVDRNFANGSRRPVDPWRQMAESYVDPWRQIAEPYFARGGDEWTICWGIELAYRRWTAITRRSIAARLALVALVDRWYRDRQALADGLTRLRGDHEARGPASPAEMLVTTLDHAGAPGLSLSARGSLAA
jgi:hypothetical protein